MCAVFGFLDYGKKVSAKALKRLLRALSVAAECRGKDATGMSYVKHGKIVTFKKAKPAHKVKMYFPRSTAAVIGHTRFALLKKCTTKRQTRDLPEKSIDKNQKL